MDGPSAERVAKNESIFREANERIESKARTHTTLSAPFLCECTDLRCTEVIPLPLADYERIRSDPTHFLVKPGHEEASGRWGLVVSSRDRYRIVEKLGEAAALAAELDERAETPPAA